MTPFLAAAAAAVLISGQASVIDGDTLEIHGQRVRLWGVDAPEGRQACTRDGQQWRCGQQAALALDELIGGRTVYCRPRGRDRYRRVVASCEIRRSEDDIADLGYSMVRAGWALDYRQYSRGAYARPEGLARQQHQGVWAGEVQPPWDWRRDHRHGSE